MTTSSIVYLSPRPVVSSHEPYIWNGEQELARLLRRRRFGQGRLQYESRFYAFHYTPPERDQPVWGGFCPDFYLPAGPSHPALNVELTFADHGLPSMTRAQFQANQRRLELKRLKIQRTSEVYGVETILITYAVFLELRRDPRHLDRLIANATARHARRRRATLAAA